MINTYFEVNCYPNFIKDSMIGDNYLSQTLINFQGITGRRDWNSEHKPNRRKHHFKPTTAKAFLNTEKTPNEQTKMNTWLSPELISRKYQMMKEIRKLNPDIKMEFDKKYTYIRKNEIMIEIKVSLSQILSVEWIRNRVDHKEDRR